MLLTEHDQAEVEHASEQQTGNRWSGSMKVGWNHQFEPHVSCYQVAKEEEEEAEHSDAVAEQHLVEKLSTAVWMVPIAERKVEEEEGKR